MLIAYSHIDTKTTLYLINARRVNQWPTEEIGSQNARHNWKLEPGNRIQFVSFRQCYLLVWRKIWIFIPSRKRTLDKQNHLLRRDTHQEIGFLYWLCASRTPNWHAIFSTQLCSAISDRSSSSKSCVTEPSSWNRVRALRPHGSSGNRPRGSSYNRPRMERVLLLALFIIMTTVGFGVVDLSLSEER